MKFFRLLIHFLVFSILTILTQVGGVIYFVSILINRRWFKEKKRLLVFPILYLLFTFAFIPLLAPLFGRSALPTFFQYSLKPHNLLTVLLNRHYVATEFKEVLLRSSESNCTFYYLDANFPFFDGFPLLPHLSHNDGNKIDLAFSYVKDSKQIKAPSFLGYGYSSIPKEGEVNQPGICGKRDYWQYNILYSTLGKDANRDNLVDKELTRSMIKSLTGENRVKKIFIEPHLKKRWNLKSSKIRFHGCHAVRHDDHIHIEFR